VGKNTHKEQCGVQVFIVLLDEVTVVLVGYTLKLIVELDAGTSCRSKAVLGERRQRFKQSILQTKNGGKHAVTNVERGRKGAR
jgi:hypothetical protein